MHCVYLKRATREESECSYHREMIETDGEKYTDYCDLIITQCVHKSNQHIMPYILTSILIIVLIKELSKIKGYKLAKGHTYTALKWLSKKI